MTDWRKANDSLDRKWAWAFPWWVPVAGGVICPVLVILFLHAFWSLKLDVLLAMLGGWLTICGACSLMRPMVRVGFLRFYAGSRDIDGGSLDPTAAETEEEAQTFNDAIAVQLVGPVLIIVGALTGGAAGLFPFVVP